MKVKSSRIVLAALVVLAIACLHCTRSGELLDTEGGSMAIIYASRVASVLTFAVAAVFFRRRLPSIPVVVVVGVSSIVMYLVGAMATLAFQGVAGFVGVQFTASAFYGIGSALYRLTFFYIVSLYAPRTSAVLLCLSLLVGNTFLWGMAYLSNELLLVVRLGFLVLCTMLLLLALLCLSRSREDFGLTAGGWVPAAEPGRKAAKGRRPGEGTLLGSLYSTREGWASCFPQTRADWVLLLVAAAIFHNLFGVVAQASSTDGAYFALYDPATSLILIGGNAALLAFMLFWGGRFDFSLAVIAIVVLYATGFALYSFAWAASSPVAGALIRGGFLASTVFMWAFMARKSYGNPSKTFFYFSILLIVANVYPGRFLGSVLVELVGSRASLLQGLSLAGLWIICLFGLLAFFMAYKSQMARAQQHSAAGGQLSRFVDTPRMLSGEAGDELAGSTQGLRAVAPSAVGSAAGCGTSAGGPFPEGGAAAGNEAAGIPAAAEDLERQRISRFAARFELSEREREVLSEMLRGRSRVAIAEMMFLSPETVKTYMTRIYRKVGVRSKQELIAVFEAEGEPK